MLYEVITGLVYIYEGFMEQLTGTAKPIDSMPAQPKAGSVSAITVVHPAEHHDATAQAKLDTEDIEFLYDMEFFINRTLGGVPHANFDEDQFREALSLNGDSIIVIADDEVIKVHVHSKAPGEVLNLALKYGEITQIHILNMREQHRESYNFV